MFPLNLRTLSMLLILLALSAHNTAFADPPPWAPAHGYYKNKDKSAPVVTGPPPRPANQYVYRGSCSWEDLGTVIGGVVGGAAGSQIGKGDGKTAATIIGTIVGAIVGSTVGRSMDATDTACIGQALEHGPIGRPVTWTNKNTNVVYRIIPTREYSTDGKNHCRSFSRISFADGRQEQADGAACRGENGKWTIVR